MVIKNLEKEKKKLEKSVRTAQESVSALKSELDEAKQRERLIVEYPDLNGPVNTDLHGKGSIKHKLKLYCVHTYNRRRKTKHFALGLHNFLFKTTRFLKIYFKTDVKTVYLFY